MVLKSKRQLLLMHGGRVIRQYRVSLGGQPVGPKERQGDHRTPEGRYVIDSRNAASRFHRALHISYPNEDDKKRARARGQDPGGQIMIHGLPNGYAWMGKGQLLYDWTDGCIAVTNEEIDEIWELVRNGTPVEIRP